jgi:hypothetical protein
MTKRRRKPQKVEPKWRMLERVVSLLERTLDPAATVEHDVRLPDLLTPGVERQCDVVVTTGPPNRRTRTIVEVQRRGRVVDISHFDAWVAKMRAVGAQHLICVSALGFPVSVKAKALQSGPSVRLVTLKELEQGSRLLQGAFGRMELREVGTRNFPSVEFLVKDPALLSLPRGAFLQHEATFRNSAGELLSLNQIAQRLLHQDSTSDLLADGLHLLHYETADAVVYEPDPRAGPARLKFTAEVAVRTTPLACEVLEYAQAPEQSPLAWALLGRATKASNDGEYEVRITFSASADGRLEPGVIDVDGWTSGDIFTADVLGRRAGPVQFVQPGPTCPAAG